MLTLQVCYSYPPDPPGGTELYVRSLCRNLAALGTEAVVAAPGSADRTYDVDGIRVCRYRHSSAPPLEHLYGADPDSTSAFAQLLDRLAPDLVHQHALTSAVSAAVARQATARGVPVVFTYHTPSVSCQRGTLLEEGARICDGRLDVARCAACTLHGLGVPPAMSRLLASVPRDWGGRVAGAGLEGGAWTALQMSHLIGRRHHETRALLDHADAIVALAPWVRTLLEVNGVPPGRIVDCPHGVRAHRPLAPAARRSGSRLRIVHLGRVDPVKGTHLLIDAMAAAPDAPIDLDVVGVVQDGAAADLRARLTARAAADTRIRFLPAFAPDEVIERLAAYDLVAVPSQWLETGPLVVLEAFAAGRPVLGSHLGGIADKVSHDVDGLLVSPYHSPGAWRDALAWCAADPARVDRLARGVRPPRDDARVAGDMDRLYRALVARARSVSHEMARHGAGR